MLKVLIGYPTPEEEFVVVERMTTPLAPTVRVLELDQLREYQKAADAVYVDPGIIHYAVRLATATRDPGSVGRGDLSRYLSFGASPRASINMILGAKALAFLRGRDYALPSDARDLARDVLRHRIVLSYEALADGIAPDDLLGPILDGVALPDVPLRQSTSAGHVGAGNGSGGQPWPTPQR
jgi:MoxR-like ATPase